MRSNLTREVAFPWSPLTASLAQAVPRKIQAPESGRSAGTASSHLIYKARSASAQPLRLGPFGCRCREPQPPAGSCAGFSADDPTSPESNWGRRYLGREGVSDSSPTQSLRTPGCSAKSGRKTAAPPLRVPAQPGWLRIKEARPPFSAFRSYLRPPSGAPRSTPHPHLRAAVPSSPPFRGAGGGAEMGGGH